MDTHWVTAERPGFSFQQGYLLHHCPSRAVLMVPAHSLSSIHFLLHQSARADPQGAGLEWLGDAQEHSGPFRRGWPGDFALHCVLLEFLFFRRQLGRGRDELSRPPGNIRVHNS